MLAKVSQKMSKQVCGKQWVCRACPTSQHGTQLSAVFTTCRRMSLWDYLAIKLTVVAWFLLSLRTLEEASCEIIITNLSNYFHPPKVLQLSGYSGSVMSQCLKIAKRCQWGNV